MKKEVLSGAALLALGCGHAWGQPPSIAQPVVPGFQIPNVANPQSGPSFAPAFQTQVNVSQASTACAVANTTISIATSATSFLLIQNPSANTASVWLSFTTAAATTGSPSWQLSPSQSIIFGDAGLGWPFLPNSLNSLNCSGSSIETVSVVYR